MMIRSFPFLLSVSGMLIQSTFVATPKKPSVFIDAQMTRHDFVTAESAAERAALPTPYENIMLALPCIYVFSPGGELLYIGTAKTESDVASTRSFLANMPASAAHLSPIKEKPKAKALLDFVPAFKSQEGKILGNGHYLVYAVSIMINGRPARSDTIPNLRMRVKDSPVDVLEVRLTQ
jgi:hypothetical protein